MPQTSGQHMTNGSLTPTADDPFLDFTELLLHEDPSHPDVEDLQHEQQQQHQQQQQQPPVQWYIADADTYEQQLPADSYVVVGADGIQRQAHTLSSSEGQAEQHALPNVIRKISNDTTIE